MNILSGLFKNELSGLRRVPWPEDMAITIADDGYGDYYVSADADGPNKDRHTMHHAWIGFWRGFKSAGEARLFAERVADRLEKIHGNRPYILTGGARTNWSSYCLGEISRDTLNERLWKAQ